jgi:hypothetical protein
MACPYLIQTGYSNSCSTSGHFSVDNEKLNNFCKDTNSFKKCATFKEWTRIQRAPFMNKIFAFSIPILYYLNILSLLFILEIINTNDRIILILGIICTLLGVVLSKKA